jgi:hypothetical protein
MELLSAILSIATIIGLCMIGLLGRSFLPAYISEKAKNLASKEDLARLTDVVEGVKAKHAAEIEEVKATLADEAHITERRRKVYEEICSALRVFIDGHGASGEKEDLFHAAYSAAWLWASDNVLGSLNHFVMLQRQRTANPEAVPEHLQKAAYVDVVLAMRRDAGFPETAILAKSYEFVKF